MEPSIGYLAVYSKTDGIVDWRSCLDPSAEHLEIRSSHCGMGMHPDAYRGIADALRDFPAGGAGKAAGRRPARLHRAA